MEKNITCLYKDSNKKEINKRILNYQDKDVEKILIFLDKFLTKKVTDKIIFNYCKEVYIKNKNTKIALGKFLEVNQEKKLITVLNHKEYIPYYNEINIIEQYSFDQLNFTDFLDLLIIKFLKYTHSENKKVDGVNNFPKYIIMKASDNQYKGKVCKQLCIDKNYFTYDKYKKIINKYEILLVNFYKTLLNNNSLY